MIVVFVVDTSPSMAEKLDIGLTRLDVAKMAVESISKSLSRRISEHNVAFSQAQQNMHNMGLASAGQDQFLLLSTSRQYENVTTCGAGGRLLVGFGDYLLEHDKPGGADYHIHSHQSFDRELKKLQAGKEEGGINTAISAGLALLSSYRFKNRSTENFGMGRLPSPAMLIPSGGNAASNALQPACLIFLTDGDWLRRGNSLELQFGNTPLREFYQEPFRWDQRIFCLGIGRESMTSTQFLHPSLRALCEVTGGCHAMLRGPASLAQSTDQLVKFIAPPRPTNLPIADPMKLPGMPPLPTTGTAASTPQTLQLPPGSFVQGGPICCFQSLEAGSHGEASPTHRAMLLYVPTTAQIQPPTWCLPESFFPSKKLDTLPPRLAQPLLTFSRHNYAMVGSNMFDPTNIMKALYRLDQLVTQNKKKLLQRDVYICEWLAQDGRPSPPPRGGRGDYFPVAVRGAGRAISEGEEPMLNIGILHVPANANGLTMSGGASSKSFCTLTILPPEPHILLPLLVKAADAEHRMLKKFPDKPRAVHLDDVWRSELRAYLFRVPPYYHNALKRCLRPILPTSVHGLLSTEGIESLALQCFSKQCLQKIRGGEMAQKETNERMERQERELRRRGIMEQQDVTVGYGQFDPRASTSSYLAALRMLPPPWRLGIGRKNPPSTPSKKDEAATTSNSEVASMVSNVTEGDKAATEVLGDLPSDCLVAYYESRRRWVFGGSGLTTRNVMVDGVCNDGSNTHRYSVNSKPGDGSLLAAAGVGVSTLNEMPTVKMGDYRERLLWTRAPIVGYGANDCSGVAATTAADGSPVWSVDDDAMPISFFDPKTGEFADSVQTRVRSRLTVHFGNPFKDKRGDSLIPEEFNNQRPPRKGSAPEIISGPTTPPGSPPHESFVEGEGEAVFASPARRSPQHSSFQTTPPPSVKKRDAEGPGPQPEGKRQKTTPDKAQATVSPEKKSMDGSPKPPPSAPRPPPPSASGSPRPPGPPKAPPVGPPPVAPPPAGPPPVAPPPAGPPPAGKPPSVPVGKAPVAHPPTSAGPPPIAPPAKQKKNAAPPPPKPKPPGPPGAKPKPPHRHSMTGAPIRGPPKAPKPPGLKEPPKAPPKAPPGARVPPPVRNPMPPAPPKKAVVAQAASVAAPAPAAAAPPQVDVESEKNPPNVNLPPGWITTWSKSQKRWYYFNTKSNKSVWQWPPP